MLPKYVLASGLDKDCARKVISENKRPQTKEEKQNLMQLIRKECLRKGQAVSSVYISCKELRVLQAKKYGIKWAQERLGKCSVLQTKLAALPKGMDPCQTKACVKSKKEDICVFKFSEQGEVGPDFCRQWSLLKQCATKIEDLGNVFPDFVIWKAGASQGEVSCDRV